MILKRKLPIREQARLVRRFATLLSVGISLPEASRLMKKKVFDSIAQNVIKGQSCSDAFSAAAVFDRSIVAMVKIGERSGTLDTALSRAADTLESRDTLSRKIIGALIYPCFIAFVTIGMAGFLIVYIFPKILPLVKSMNIPLPLLTRLLMHISDILIHDSVAIFISFILFISTAKVLWKYSILFRRYIRRIILLLPIVGSISQGQIIINIFRSLGLLLEHGELLPAALISIAKNQVNDDYRKVLYLSAQAITKGDDFALSIFHKKLFPRFVSEFIDIGERTGSIARTCEHIALIFESDVEELIKRVSVVIEPVLMLCMGITVGSIALSIVMPIYEITNHLTK